MFSEKKKKQSLHDHFSPLLYVHGCFEFLNTLNFPMKQNQLKVNKLLFAKKF